MKQTNQPGYILALTLAFVSMLMFLGAYVANKGLIFGSYSRTMINREKAAQLARGGIQLALSQIAGEPTKQQKDTAAAQKDAQKKDQKSGQQPTSDGKQLLKQILPILNKPQTFALKQSVEGITGTVAIAIGSEEGKINLNAVYDFDKHKFVGEGNPQGDMKKMMQEVFNLIKERTGADLFSTFEKHLKERKYPINDVTELLTLKGFEVFRNTVFFDPFLPVVVDKKQLLFLSDLFTLESSRSGLEPWFLSPSVLAAMGLKRDTEKSIDDVLKTFKERADWKTDWAGSLKNLYSVDYAALPKGISSLFMASFEPQFFNVISVGTVGGISVRMLAIIERVKPGQDGKAKVYVRKVTVL